MSPTTREETVTRAVVATLAYAAAIEQTFTSVDVWQWLYRCRATLGEVHGALVALEQTGVVTATNGRYRFADQADGRDAHSGYVYALQKMRTARRFARFLCLVPGVRAVGVCNSLALDLADSESDIDLFVIAENGWLWIVRFLATMPLLLFRRRPQEASVDPICLSFFVSTSGLNVDAVRACEEDPHFAHWLGSVVPLVGADAFADLAEANVWMHTMFPQVAPRSVMRTMMVARRPMWAARALCHLMTYLRLSLCLERWMRRLQERWFPLAIRSAIGKGTSVVVNDQLLKLHTTDRRAAYAAQWRSWMQRYAC